MVRRVKRGSARSLLVSVVAELDDVDSRFGFQVLVGDVLEVKKVGM
jgi:hypothetical protein